MAAGEATTQRPLNLKIGDRHQVNKKDLSFELKTLFSQQILDPHLYDRHRRAPLPLFCKMASLIAYGVKHLYQLLLLRFISFSL
jgi:hypothetical protein